MKKLITISTVLVLMVVTTSVTYALPSDNFDNNSIDAIWNLYEDDPGNAWLDETNHRLELRSTAVTEDSVAVYVANGWGFSPAHNFSFKADFHNSFTSDDPAWATVMLGIGKGSDLATIRGNNAIIDAAWDRGDEYNQPQYSVFGYSYTVDGNESESSFHETRGSSDGTLYVSYDAGEDELYLSHTGYGKDKASDTIPDLLNDKWGGAVVTLFIGGDVENVVALDSGVAYLDNFVIDSGTIIPEPVSAAIMTLASLFVALKRRKR